MPKLVTAARVELLWSGVRGQGLGVRGQRSEVRGQGLGVRGQRSEVRGQESEVRGQGSGVRVRFLVI